MATGTFNFYGLGAKDFLDGGIDFTGDTIKVGLTTSAYTPNKDTDQFYSDITNEVAGAGYVAGGETLANAATSYDAATDQARIDGDNVVWSGATIAAARTMFVYKSTGVAATSALIGYATFDGDVSVTGGDLTLAFNALGIGAIDVT